MSKHANNLIALERTESIKKFILDYHAEYHISPSVREIAQAIGLGTTTTHYWIEFIRQTGWFVPVPKSNARSYVPMEMIHDQVTRINQ